MSCRILRRRACMSPLPRCFKFTDVYISSSSGGNVSSSGSCTPREEVITLGKSAVRCKYLQHRKIIQIATAEKRSTCVLLSRACMSSLPLCWFQIPRRVMFTFLLLVVALSPLPQSQWVSSKTCSFLSRACKSPIPLCQETRLKIGQKMHQFKLIFKSRWTDGQTVFTPILSQWRWSVQEISTHLKVSQMCHVSLPSWTILYFA